MNETGALRFFNPLAHVRRTANQLPHWQQAGAVYFVTFRLADALPASLLDDWKRERTLWLSLHPSPPPWTTAVAWEYHARFSVPMERWLDAGHGTCVLRRPGCAEAVAAALRHFDGERCALLAWVIMPNHVHLLVVPAPGWPLESLLHTWKRFTARRINEQLGQTGHRLWQRDYFDRLVRDEDHFADCVRYLRANPRKARLREGEFLLHEGEEARAIV